MTLLQTLLIDNYDSYTYNLFQLLAEVNGVEPIVHKNDAINIQQVQQLVAEGTVHNIVISPGPGSPDNPVDIGVNIDVLQQLTDVPVLGVCLGHQALAVAAGGKVVRAPEPVHGRLSELHHTGHLLLHDIPSGIGQGFDVVRYHSLVVDAASLPSCLEAVAWTHGQHHAVATAQSTQQSASALHASDSTGQQAAGMQSEEQEQPLIMALVHKHRPHYGVQFHPESICTRYGMQLMLNFHGLSSTHLRRNFELPRSLSITPLPQGCPHPPHPWPSQHQQAAGHPLRLAWRCCNSLLPSQDMKGSLVLFEGLFGWQPHTFWLDSATVDRGRFSFMGAQGGPLWRCITYTLPPPGSCQPHSMAAANGHAVQHNANTAASVAECSPALRQQRRPSEDRKARAISGMLPLKDVTLDICEEGSDAVGAIHVTDADGHAGTCRVRFFHYLRQLLATHQLQHRQEAAQQLPFNFWGGLVGYLGYELKAECGGDRAHASPTPDAALLFVDRLIAIDHKTGDVYAVAVYEASVCPSTNPDSAPNTISHAQTAAGGGMSESSQQAAQAWVDSTAKQAMQLLQHKPQAAAPAEVQQAQAAAPTSNGLVPASGKQPDCNGAHVGSGGMIGAAAKPPFRLRHNREQYISNIGGCIRCLYSGESYEVCLTTALVRRGAPHPPTLYKTLRALNPAPYAAWLNFGQAGPTICCSSPERFLRGDRGGVLEARPIKGTAARRIGQPAEDAAAAASLAASEKDRAENLMIVDLLRNDLGRVCTVGSVHVPGLMEIESYATVHQMVSTVRGVRRPDASLVDAIQAAFPAGSMTGAPKIRTMQIIDGLENGARGVYSGCVGFISLNDCFDLNVVIRTAVIHQDSARHAKQDATGTASSTEPHVAKGCNNGVAACTNGQNGSVAAHGNGQNGSVAAHDNGRNDGLAAHHSIQHPNGLSGKSAAPPQLQHGGIQTPASAGSNGLGPSLNSDQWQGHCLDDLYVRIGAGGAIVVQSDLVDEFDEMRLKAKALLAAVGQCDGLTFTGASDGNPALLDVQNAYIA